MADLTATTRASDLRRGALALIAATAVVYLGETVAGIALGAAAGSPALTGLGLDSAVKLLGALVLGWELGGRWDAAQERVALRMLALVFFAVAAFLAVQGVRGLADPGATDVPSAGLIAAGLGALLLPPLVVAKRVLARALDSATLASDADKTRLSAILCVAVLVGLTLHLTLGWTAADPAASLAIAALAAREGAQDWIEADALDRHPSERGPSGTPRE